MIDFELLVPFYLSPPETFRHLTLTHNPHLSPPTIALLGITTRIAGISSTGIRAGVVASRGRGGVIALAALFVGLHDVAHFFTESSGSVGVRLVKGDNISDDFEDGMINC